VQKYQEMHRLVQEPGGHGFFLYIGAENWPFRSRWCRAVVFGDSSRTQRERIPFSANRRDEVQRIGICHALVAAETRPGADMEMDGLVNTVLPNVAIHRSVPFHGYYFRILSNRMVDSPPSPIRLCTGLWRNDFHRQPG